MLTLSRIAIFTRDTEQDYRLESLRKLFARARIEVLDAPDPATTTGVDLVIALGGDGTVLRALSAFPGIPVLAVNFGHLGFLTASERGELDSVLVRLLADDYFIEERLTLHVRHRGAAYRCINEVVVKATLHMVSMAIGVNGQPARTVRGDGIIVGTPTGSTGYLLSTGAPIVTPEVDCIIVKPLNEYALGSRSVILPGEARVSIELLPDERGHEVLLIPDGMHAVDVRPGELIEVERSHIPARLVYFERDYFFRNLKSRLQW